MSQKNDDAPMLNDWASGDAISQMEWSPGSPGLYPPLSSDHESLSKPTRQNETLFGDLNTSMAEAATITLSGTGMTQMRGPEPIGQFQKHFTKPLVPFLTMVYLRAESILQVARSVRVFHMQSRYIARQALNLVILLNDLVDPEEGPDDTQQTGRIHLEDDLIKLLEAMEKWGACGEQGGSVDSEQHLLKIQHHYTQIFKKRFYFHDVRDYANDIVYQKLLAYDQRTIENRQRCQISGNIIQVDYWIGHEEHYLEDQEEPEVTREIRMASSITLGSTGDVVPFSGYESAAPTEAVGYSPLETSMMSIDESDSIMKIYDLQPVSHFRPPPYNPLRDISETPLPIQNKSTDNLLVGAHDGDLPTAHGHTSNHPDPSSPGSYSRDHQSRNSIASDGIVETSGPKIRQGLDHESIPTLAHGRTANEGGSAPAGRRETHILPKFAEGDSLMKQEDDKTDDKVVVSAIRTNHRLNRNSNELSRSAVGIPTLISTSTGVKLDQFPTQSNSWPGLDPEYVETGHYNIILPVHRHPFFPSHDSIGPDINPDPNSNLLNYPYSPLDSQHYPYSPLDFVASPYPFSPEPGPPQTPSTSEGTGYSTTPLGSGSLMSHQLVPNTCRSKDPDLQQLADAIVSRRSSLGHESPPDLYIAQFFSIKTVSGIAQPATNRRRRREKPHPNNLLAYHCLWCERWVGYSKEKARQHFLVDLNMKGITCGEPECTWKTARPSDFTRHMKLVHKKDQPKKKSGGVMRVGKPFTELQEAYKNGERAFPVDVDQNSSHVSEPAMAAKYTHVLPHPIRDPIVQEMWPQRLDSDVSITPYPVMPMQGVYIVSNLLEDPSFQSFLHTARAMPQAPSPGVETAPKPSNAWGNGLLTLDHPAVTEYLELVPHLKHIIKYLIEAPWYKASSPEPPAEELPEELGILARRGSSTPRSLFGEFFSANAPHTCLLCPKESPQHKRSLERALGHSRQHFNFKPIEVNRKTYANSNTKNDQERRSQIPAKFCIPCSGSKIPRKNMVRHIESSQHKSSVAYHPEDQDVWRGT